MKVRKWIRIIHRDFGYLFFGLTVIYSISGIAVNHADDWNPNYIIEKKEVFFSPLPDSTLSDQFLIAHITAELGIKDSIISSFRLKPTEIQLFYEGKNLKADILQGKGIMEVIKSRTGIRETNYLHLNHPKKYWTYVADAFALALIALAITGLFMIKGRKGITGRGAWLTAAGLIIPVIFLLLYYY